MCGVKLVGLELFHWEKSHWAFLCQSCSPLTVLFCHLLTCCMGSQNSLLLVLPWSLSQPCECWWSALVSSGIVFTKSSVANPQKSGPKTVVVAHPICSRSFGGGSAQPRHAHAHKSQLLWPHKSRLQDLAFVHSDVLKALNLQSLAQGGTGQSGSYDCPPKAGRGRGQFTEQRPNGWLHLQCSWWWSFALRWPRASFRCFLMMELRSAVAQGFFDTHLLVAAVTTLQSPLTVSLQPAAVLSPSLSSEPTPADAPPGLEETRCWHGLSAQVFLCSACHKRVVVLFWSQILLFCPGLISFPPVRRLSWCKLFFLFQLPPQGHRVSSCIHFHFFSYCPTTSYIETFPVLSGMWGLLLIFCTCSVRIFEDVLLMYLWEEVSFQSWSCYSAILVGFLFRLFLKIKPLSKHRFSFHLQPRWTNRDWIILSPSVWGIFLSVLYKKRRQG